MMTGHVELVPLQPGQLPTLRNLMQLYLYDFSIFFCEGDYDDIGEDGLYDPGFRLERYVEQPGYRAYLARLDRKLAGFVLLSERTRYRPRGRIVDEFFVLRCYRGRGVGRRLAWLTFDTHQGYWEVAEIKNNTPAQAFWRRVIGEYTSDRYEEIINDTGEVWQMFDSSG
jgi:predicted acetyltransferase